MNSTTELPNPLPRPPGELDELKRLWNPPRGLRFLTVINNNYIGVAYVGTAFVFFVLAGILALVMRTQLAVPNNNLVSPQLYDQLFTMHGTVMMFLFAVPAVEAMGVLLLPNMLGARDLPFPRLSAYAYWAYLVGGTVFFGSLFANAAPSGGWFMNPPLTSATWSPGVGADFWLLGIGFIEISAIAGAIEIIVGVLRTRAPGMTLDRMPVFAWAMLVFALMIVFAFPAIILATLLLEFERAFGWPFFEAAKGGDPLLWQHLFWFFGHPEVYIIFLPAAGMVSMILPTMARTPLVAHRAVVIALVATGFLSFGLWVHHMFATGIPQLSLSFFQAASMAVAVPSGIQVFAWIATLARGRLDWRATPSLFLLGFLFTFVAGGLTGVMVAVIPFDWQAHDSYFIVAHLHYVLIGGMVFPLLAAFYYWLPYTSKHALSERVGRWVFALVFTGFHVAFAPMHVTGLLGMPRRVYTYDAAMGWNVLNLVSTLGAFMIAAGVALFLFDLARKMRMSAEGNAGNVWRAGTLEWLPNGNYSSRSIPRVESREPLWTHAQLADEVEQGRWYLPGTATGGRETILTHPLSAEPQALMRMPMPGWAPVIGAIFTAGFFLLLTVKLVVPALVCAVIAIGGIVHWAWGLDPSPLPRPLPIGGGIELQAYLTGPSSHSWWAMVVLMLVSASLYGSAVISYLYLWTVSPEVWPRAEALPGLAAPLAAALLLLASSGVVAVAGRALARARRRLFMLLMALAIGVVAAAFGIDLAGQHDVSPSASSHGAAVWMFIMLEGFFVAVAVTMAVFAVARALARRLDGQRRVVFDNVRLWWHYTVAQSLVGLVLVHGFPRLVT
ncbi:MAG: cbb3-type cytochrome c oxidase subunit I [Betaproteobacteria bacterium]|nr:cbb3-type cytochrome c oxidase subunit I [Betaproteobacteria bacterium]